MAAMVFGDMTIKLFRRRSSCPSELLSRIFAQTGQLSVGDDVNELDFE